MRVGHILISRAQYYDRNPATLAGYYSSGAVGPHLTTVRWAYTVPAGRKAYVESLLILLNQVTAPGVSSAVLGWIRAFLLSSTDPMLLIARLSLPVLGSITIQTQTSQALLLAGDQLIAYTADLNTGGQCEYHLAGKWTEFDI